MPRTTLLVGGFILMLGWGLPGKTEEPEPAAPEKNWGLEGGADYSSIYLFRGAGQLPGDANALLPYLKYNWKRLTATYYGIFGDLPEGGMYREHDFSLDYTVPLGEVADLTAGATAYLYNGDAERALGFLDSYEAYAIVAFKGPLSPTLSYYRDVDKIKGGYLTLGVSHSVELGSRVSLDVSTSAGFDFHYNNKAVGNGTFNDVLVGLDLPILITDKVTFHLLVQRTFSQKSLDDAARSNPELARQYRNQTLATAGLSVAF